MSVAPLTKTDIARRQLGTALSLYLANADPVSVHTLAVAGSEIAEQLASIADERNFFAVAGETSSLTLREMREARNVYANAFKHFDQRSGLARDDGALMVLFSDEQNELALFIGWFDYMQATKVMPVEAQVFQLWVWAKRTAKLSIAHDPTLYAWLFPDLPTKPLFEQKLELRSRIAWAKSQSEVMADLKTDRRPLVLQA